MRIIGDVHGRYAEYNKLASEAERSVCVGDVGFEYDGVTLDPLAHKIIGGNHDCYELVDDKFKQSPHFLGDFGMHYSDIDFFWARGGCSIDRKWRSQGIDFWPDEELSMASMHQCIDLYLAEKPSMVISHECPSEICSFISNADILRDYGFKPDWTSKTAQMLQAMFESHRPNLWIFGHHHRSWLKQLGGCTFLCLPILGHVDI